MCAKMNVSQSARAQKVTVRQRMISSIIKCHTLIPRAHLNALDVSWLRTLIIICSDHAHG